MKIFVLYARENWITDELAKEWINNNRELYTNNINEADTIWILSNYVINTIPDNIYKSKRVITTIHHIVPWKIDDKLRKHYKKLNDITDIFHSICSKTTHEVKKHFTKKIITAPFWHNESVWKFLDDKKNLREKYNFNTKDFLVGSFQKDTEGNSISNKTFKPKLEKGPDIFVRAVKLLKEKKYPNLKVVLTGYFRNYIIHELKNNNIEFYYFEKCNFKDLNNLFNCLDLYIIGSRVEGGPRAINECGLTKTPLLSTDVGISDLLCAPESIFDINNIESILDCKTNIDYNFKEAQKYLINIYMEKFNDKVFN